jgi:DNA-directed RNA polymerase sigma subunit (sigma70/sigma32)
MNSIKKNDSTAIVSRRVSVATPTRKTARARAQQDDAADRLAAGGWKSGSAAEFLGLSPEEEAIVEMRLALHKLLKECMRHMTQKELAARMGLTAGRITQIMNGYETSMEQTVRAILATGASLRDVARAIQRAESKTR